MRSQSTRHHHYPFTFRSCAFANSAACQDKVYLYIVPPEDAVTIERLYVHLRFTFDSSVAVGNRVVEAIGIGNELPLLIGQEPSRYREVVLNQAADGDRKVDIRVDLTHLLEKTHAKYRDFFNDPATEDMTYVVLKLHDNLRGVLTVGTINLWKIDALFTTRAIH